MEIGMETGNVSVLPPAGTHLGLQELGGCWAPLTPVAAPGGKSWRFPGMLKQDWAPGVPAVPPWGGQSPGHGEPRTVWGFWFVIAEVPVLEWFEFKSWNGLGWEGP